MKQFSCKDLGEECEAICQAETLEEVKALALAHLQKSHAEKLKQLSKTELERFKDSLTQWITDSG